MRPVLCIVGPTASGKTALSVALAEKFGGEIVSADSMQLYRGIHIASAAPDTAEKHGIPHHLIEILDLSDRCTVADYVEWAKKKIDEISERKKLPVVVGGTGLYVDALLSGTQFVPEKSDPALRERLMREANESGGARMLDRLAEIDPQTAARLHPNDTRRIVRALEVFYSTGKTLTAANADSHLAATDYDVLRLGLCFADRAALYDRIDRRVDEMMANGLLAEAESTMDLEGGALQAIGHKELYPYLRGECSLEEAVASLKQATRHYAKRQLTWFRRDPSIRWIEAGGEVPPLIVAEQLVKEWKKPYESEYRF